MPKRTTLTFTSADRPRTVRACPRRLLRAAACRAAAAGADASRRRRRRLTAPRPPPTPPLCREQEEHALYVYHCRYTGLHALTTDVEIDTLPRRRTDNARILDTSTHVTRLYTSEGDVVLLRRCDPPPAPPPRAIARSAAPPPCFLASALTPCSHHPRAAANARSADGRIERQYRQHMSDVPIAYRSEPDGALLYILDGALTSFRRTAARHQVPLPPCIRASAVEGATDVVLDIAERVRAARRRRRTRLAWAWWGGARTAPAHCSRAQAAAAAALRSRRALP
jgi:hypothetical protein